MANHHLLIISLLSLIADQCGGVEIGVWGLVQRLVFGCDVEIDVRLWVCHGFCLDLLWVTWVRIGVDLGVVWRSALGYGFVVGFVWVAVGCVCSDRHE